MKRRDFLKTTIAGVGALAFGARLHAEETQSPKKASDIIPLGNTGLKASRLALGTGSHGSDHASNQTRMGLAGLAALFKAGYDQGVNFWDSADQYGSHPHVREALKTIPREKVVILTKTHASTAEEMKRDLDRFRRELGTDYIDILLLHCMMDPKWPEVKAGAMDVISQAREKGIIKAHGTSCHTFEALQAAAASDWVQVDLARINPAGVIMDAPPDKVVPVLTEMKRKGKAVIGMKIFGEGKLVDRRDECLRYVLGLDCVDSFSIGCESREQLDDLLVRIPANTPKA